jgi:SSS family solute:Na+ symporter
MSAVSALANSVGTIFSLDVYRRFFRPQANDRQLILAGRVASGAALVLACAAAPMVEHVGIFRYFQTGVTYMATPFVSVILLGILWKRTNYPAALAGLIGGLIVQVSLALLFWNLGIELHWLYVGFLAQVITMGLIVAVTLATQHVAPVNSDLLQWRPELLTQLGRGEQRPWFKQVKFWFALYAILWVAIYWRFW